MVSTLQGGLIGAIALPAVDLIQAGIRTAIAPGADAGRTFEGNLNMLEGFAPKDNISGLGSLGGDVATISMLAGIGAGLGAIVTSRVNFNRTLAINNSQNTGNRINVGTNSTGGGMLNTLVGVSMLQNMFPQNRPSSVDVTRLTSDELKRLVGN